MRYYLEFPGNSQGLVVHVDNQVSVDIVQFYSSAEENLPRLARDLFATEGVVHVSLMPHEVFVEKAAIFEWKEMVSAILACIHDNLDPDGELVETKPPVTRESGQNSSPPQQTSDDSPEKEAIFEFRCRRCGEVFDFGHLTDADSALDKLEFAIHHEITDLGASVHQTNVHNCKTGGVGVGDLIGYRIEEAK